MEELEPQLALVDFWVGLEELSNVSRGSIIIYHNTESYDTQHSIDTYQDPTTSATPIPPLLCIHFIALHGSHATACGGNSRPIYYCCLFKASVA